MTEPDHGPAADQTPVPEAPVAPPDVERPTYQTAASEAVDVAAQAVAQRVAANQAARMAAAEAAAAREAEEAARVAEAAEAAQAAEAARAAEAAQAAELQASMGAAPSFPADAPAPLPDPSWTGTTDASMAAAATVPMSTAEAATIPATPTGVMIPTEPAVMAPALAAPAVVAPAAAPATPRPSRRPMVVGLLRRLVVFALSTALLVGGVVLGSATFQRTRAAAPVGGGGEVELTQPPPDIAKEFITALAAGDSDAIRSSLSPQPNKDITDEFTKFGIKKVMGVDTLGTSVDGPRSATEVLLHTVTTEGNKFDINLIILVNGNTIEGFR